VTRSFIGSDSIHKRDDNVVTLYN